MVLNDIRAVASTPDRYGPRRMSCGYFVTGFGLMQVMEEKVTDVNVDVATVSPEEGYKLYNKEQVAEILTRI
jgi:hypothetical protein